MPNYVSKSGEWNPSKEKVGLSNKSKQPFKYKNKIINPGEPFIYEGPDRAALVELEKLGTSTMGINFKRDPEFIRSVKNQGFDTVEDYLKYIDYNEEEVEKAFKEKAEVVMKHELPERVKEIKELAGGRDTAGSQHRYGGFGDIPNE